MDGNLTGLGCKHFALDTDDITYIIFLEILVGFFSDAVSCNVCLDAAL